MVFFRSNGTSTIFKLINEIDFGGENKNILFLWLNII